MTHKKEYRDGEFVHACMAASFYVPFLFLGRDKVLFWDSFIEDYAEQHVLPEYIKVKKHALQNKI